MFILLHLADGNEKSGKNSGNGGMHPRFVNEIPQKQSRNEVKDKA